MKYMIIFFSFLSQWKWNMTYDDNSKIYWIVSLVSTAASIGLLDLVSIKGMHFWTINYLLLRTEQDMKIFYKESFILWMKILISQEKQYCCAKFWPWVYTIHMWKHWFKSGHQFVDRLMVSASNNPSLLSQQIKPWDILFSWFL